MVVIRQLSNGVLSSLRIAVETSVPPCILLQVRFRKPRSLGRAPSKDRSYFKKFYPTEKDLKESVTIYRNYNTTLKSLVLAFQEELVHEDNIKNTIGNQKNAWNEEAHHKKCMAYNDEENERLLKIRLARIEESKKLEASKIAEEDLARQNELEELRATVAKTIEESEHWITLENMEEKIAEALDNPMNYNFAINRSGMITERTALLLPPDDERYDSE